MTQQKLEELFNSCGRIITSRILYDSNTGASRGVGFIRFDQRVEAERAIKQLNGIVPENGTEPITVKLANSPAAAAAAAAAASTSSTSNTNGIKFHLSGLPSNEFGLVDETVFSNKPNQAALTTTMMLLQQVCSGFVWY
ncbi:hypothetical protein P879_11072 [Paragonimus westermani]|uniref:RRM domain-containing protein n=1 Tax=Paragonimus westermani TaxID=34504 RepID=A0A8T0D4G8_9TREM|nr:hypothetical protein P879_11072 [Paragonimus westermani]